MTSETFTGRTAIITGAARGLGRDYARMFAADGAHVVIADRNNGQAAAADASTQGPGAIWIETDITDPVSTAAMAERVMAEFGRIDMLINNAGVWRNYPVWGLLGCPKDAWDAAWQVNVSGSLHCYQAVVPAMKAAGWGRIVNVSSQASALGATAYGITKAAVEQMTSGMAREVGPFGITANCIAPGATAFENAKGNIHDLDEIIARNAIPRVGRTSDLYGAIRYLCSEEAGWVTGETLRVDGGSLTR